MSRIPFVNKTACEHFMDGVHHGLAMSGNPFNQQVILLYEDGLWIVCVEEVEDVEE